MKLDQLISNLKSYKQTYGNLDVVYSSDDEGNRIEEVQFAPTPMKKGKDGYYDTSTEKPTHLCVN